MSLGTAQHPLGRAYAPSLHLGKGWRCHMDHMGAPVLCNAAVMGAYMRRRRRLSCWLTLFAVCLDGTLSHGEASERRGDRACSPASDKPQAGRTDMSLPAATHACPISDVMEAHEL